MKIQCRICNSMIEDVSGVCPVCGAPVEHVRTEHQAEPITDRLRGGPAAGGGYGQENAWGTAYGEVPYNYQNPGTVPAGNTKQKKVLSILAIVLAILSIVTICLPGLSVLCSIAAIVLAIIALVKKQIKVPAILGIVFGSIFFLIGILYLGMNLMLQSVIHTNVNGIIRQCWDAYRTEPQSLDETGVYINYPDGERYYYAFRIAEGYWETHSVSSWEAEIVNGTYQTYNYMSGDERIQDAILDEILAAMQEGYEIKDVTCVVLSEPKKVVDTDSNGLVFADADYKEKILVFVFPEDYQMGDSFYLIQMTGENDYELVPIDGQISIEPDE